MKKKILILEDTQHHFEAIRHGLIQYFDDYIEIYPDITGIKDKSLSSWSKLISKAREGTVEAYEEIIKVYNNIDLFIIDVNLLSSRVDKYGEAFWECIKASNIYASSVKVVFMSVNQIPTKELNPAFEAFVNKSRILKDLVTKVIEKISILLEIKPQTNNFKRSETSTAVESTSLIYNYETRKEIFADNPGYALRVNLEEKEGKIALWFDLIIKMAFVLMILGALIFSMVRILKHCILLESHVKAERTIMKDQIPIELSVAENVFLCLLPLFIVFGFFIYYKSNISIYLLSGNTDNIKDEVSTRAMSLTKTLFIGSLISYLLIKTIEILFYDVLPSIRILTSIGVLIIFLMIYFITLEKLNHKSHNSTN